MKKVRTARNLNDLKKFVHQQRVSLTKEKNELIQENLTLEQEVFLLEQELHVLDSRLQTYRQSAFVKLWQLQVRVRHFFRPTSQT